MRMFSKERKRSIKEGNVYNYKTAVVCFQKNECNFKSRNNTNGKTECEGKNEPNYRYKVGKMNASFQYPAIL